MPDTPRSCSRWTSGGYAAEAGDGTVAPQQEPQARRAIADCPVHAIVELQS